VEATAIQGASTPASEPVKEQTSVPPKQANDDAKIATTPDPEGWQQPKTSTRRRGQAKNDPDSQFVQQAMATRDKSKDRPGKYVKKGQVETTISGKPDTHVADSHATASTPAATGSTTPAAPGSTTAATSSKSSHRKASPCTLACSAFGFGAYDQVPSSSSDDQATETSAPKGSYYSAIDPHDEDDDDDGEFQGDATTPTEVVTQEIGEQPSMMDSQSQSLEEDPTMEEIPIEDPPQASISDLCLQAEQARDEQLAKEIGDPAELCEHNKKSQDFHDAGTN
jgi:hypothetical protein